MQLITPKVHPHVVLLPACSPVTFVFNSSDIRPNEEIDYHYTA